MQRLLLSCLVLVFAVVSGTGAARAQDAVEADVRFPSAGDPASLQVPPTLRTQGDSIRGLRTLPIARVDDVDLHFVLEQNRLADREDCVLLIDLLLNDVALGQLTVPRGVLSVDAFLRPEEGVAAVVGEDGSLGYTFELRVAETLPAGCNYVQPSLGRSTWHLEIEDPPGNVRPRATIGGPYEVDEGGEVTVAVEASDPDGQELTFAWDFDGEGDFDDAEGPEAVFDAAALDGPSEQAIRVRVRDAGGAERVVSSLVAVLNLPPAFADEPRPETVAAQDNLYTFQPVATDPSALDVLTYSLLRRPQGMEVDPATGLVQWTPAAGDVGSSFVVRLKVADDEEASDVIEWTIQVVQDPDVPWVDAGDDRAVDPGCLELTCTGTDPRNRPLRFTWRSVRGPAPVVFQDPALATVTAVVSIAGDYTFECVAVEDVAEAEGPLTSPPDQVTLTVRNLPPLADPGFTVYGATKQRITLDGRRSVDPNGDGLRYRWEQIPGAGPAVRISGMNNSITSFYPLETDIYCFSLTVSDGGGLASEPAEVCVVVDEPGDPAECEQDADCRETTCLPVPGQDTGRCEPFTEPNTNPVAWAGEDIWAQVGSQVQLRGLRSFDPDSGQPFVEDYQWTQTCGPVPVELEGASQAPTFMAAEPGRYCFSLTVLDADLHRSLPDQVQVMVESEDNHAPWVDAGAPITVAMGDEVTLDGSASWDPDGDELTFVWRQLRGPAVTLDDPTSPQAHFCAAIPGIYQFELVAADQELEGLPQELWVSVYHPSNMAPVARAGSDFRVLTDVGVPDDLTSRAILDGRQSFDPDAPEFLADPRKYLKFQWVQIDGLPVSLQLPFTRRPWFRTPRWGIHTFRLFLLDSWPDEDPGQAGFVQAPSDWVPAWSTPDDVVVVVNDRPGAAGGNSVPEANAGPDIDCLLGERCTLDARASVDDDGDELTYRWLLKEGSPVELLDATTVMPSFQADNLGEWRFVLVVADPYVQSMPDEVLVRVRPNDNVAPVCRAGRDVTARPGSVVVLNGCGSLDANGDDLEFTWTQTDGPALELRPVEGDESCKAELTLPADVASDTTFTFELTASDGRSDCEADEVIVTAALPHICEPDAAPVSCQCDDGGQGQRTCNADGQGWSDCTDCHLPCACIADEVSACRCEDGTWGDRLCAADCSAWSECGNCGQSGEGEGEGEGDGSSDGCSCSAPRGSGQQLGGATLVLLLGFVLVLRRR